MCVCISQFFATAEKGASYVIYAMQCYNIKVNLVDFFKMSMHHQRVSLQHTSQKKGVRYVKYLATAIYMGNSHPFKGFRFILKSS